MLTTAAPPVGDTSVTKTAVASMAIIGRGAT